MSVVVMACAAPVWADEGVAATSFEAGIAAYRAGEYTLARDRFLQARAQGNVDDEVRFNLALSYYKLGDFVSAQTEFETLRGSEKLAAVAEYHLGLVAAQRGLNQQAARHLRATQTMTDSIELRQLAELALQRLGAVAASRRLFVSTTLGAGFDSNRTQSSETVRLAQVEPEAGFTELSVVLRYRADEWFGSELRGGFFLRDYTPDHELDQHSAQLSLRKSWIASAWQFGAAAESEVVWLGGERFQNAVGGNLDAGWSRGASTLSLRYRPSFIAGGDDYAYLEGWSQRAELGYSFAPPAYRLRLYYETEVNDRHDLERGEEFFSQSPIRHGVGARLNHRLASALFLDWSARYRHSRYRDTSHFFDADELVQERRLDELVQLGVIASLKLGKGWGLRLDYRYTDNRSRVERYDYARHTVLLGVDWGR